VENGVPLTGSALEIGGKKQSPILKQKGHSPDVEEYPLNFENRLDYSDIDSRRAFLPLLYVKRNLIALVQGLEAGRIDG
jgi:hypothetical protein